MAKSIERLQYLCNTIPGLLSNMDENTFSTKPGPDKWSKKEVIGHLIDSATNNHHRLVRGQFEEIPKIRYDQNKWNESNYYQQMESSQIISFWTVYNKQLLELMKRIPEDKLTNQVETEKVVTLQFIIEDYVVHMEHHLRQVVEY